MSSGQGSDFARLEQLLQEERRNRQEVEERVELERRRAEEERQSGREADERAQLERQDADDEQKHVEKSFVGTERCGLCRLQLPWGSLLGQEAWQCAFRAGTL